MASTITARGAAAAALETILEGTHAPEVLASLPSCLSEADRRLVHEIVLGTLRHLTLLDAVVALFCRRPTRHLPLRLQAILRTTAYQILFLRRVPAYAAVSEAVHETRRAGFARQAGFVNAVLRKVAGVEDPVTMVGASTQGVEDLARRYSHPISLVDRWTERHDPSLVESWMARSNEAPVHYLAVHTGRITVESLRERAAELGVVLSEPYPGLPLLACEGSVQPLEPLMSAGLAFHQDLGSHLVVSCLPEEVSGPVLDACAAPGGKSFALALRFPGMDLMAMDRYSGRLATMQSRAHLLEMEARIRFLVGDAASPPFPDESFGLVLVDAPCSGTGTLQKNPDIRWRFREADILRMARGQGSILRGAATLVRPGGVLAYATCSAEAEENELVVGAFLASHPQFRREPARVPDPALQTEEGYLRTFPVARRGEGLFCAVLRREP